MNGRCNRISLDTDALMNALSQRAERALKAEGDKLIAIMEHEVQLTTNGGAPGKPAWREEIADNLGHVATTITADGISMDFGYSPSGMADKVRAMVVAYGSGEKADGGGEKIHAGPPGRSVWDADLTGRHPSRAHTEHPLPDEFNQTGNQFVRNALRRAQTQFGGLVEAAFEALPDRMYWEKVRVSPP